ncbi:dihydroorotate dehydrogenase B (NAD(+)), electron transfer subunit [Spirochaetia bacterium]|nr:dihydroorotate dehydrogenase B (NAD(+)), electron transfer subunit [Spirochaetia bacterium]
MDNQKQYVTGKVLANKAINGEIFRLDIAWSGPAPHTGQFFLIKPKRSGIFLARPISVALWEKAVEDTPQTRRRLRGKRGDYVTLMITDSIRFLIARRGPGTEELAGIQTGEEVELTGPLGNCWGNFFPPEDTRKPLALLGGGIGVAPLEGLPGEFPKYDFDFYAGFRTGFKTDEERYGILGPAAFDAQNLIIATEDGSEGKKGRITDFLDPIKYAVVYACGPTAMLRAVTEKCKALGVPCYISMEKHMACGVGACLGCTVKTKNGNKRCCADGPIFPAEELIFE